jgi:hypothetical protein
MMAPQMSSTADGRCLHAIAPFCRQSAVSRILASASHGMADPGGSDVAPPIERCNSTAVAEPRPSRRGRAHSPKAHTRSRNVRMPKVSTAAATSPEVMTTDSRSIALAPPRPGCLCPFIDARRHQPHLLDTSRRFRAAGRRVHRRRLIHHSPHYIATQPHLAVVQAMGHRGSRLLIARGHVTHGVDHVQRH